jgi:hypothetical protein
MASFKNSSTVAVSAITEHSRWQKQDPAQKRKYGLQRDADQAQRQRDEPNQREQHQNQKRQGPTKHEQQKPAGYENQRFH